MHKVAKNTLPILPNIDWWNSFDRRRGIAHTLLTNQLYSNAAYETENLSASFVGRLWWFDASSFCAPDNYFPEKRSAKKNKMCSFYLNIQMLGLIDMGIYLSHYLSLSGWFSVAQSISGG